MAAKKPDPKMGELRAEIEAVVRRAFGRFGSLYDTLSRHFYGYESAIRDIIIASMANEPFVLVGDPGHGKTLLMTTFFRLIGLAKADRMVNGVPVDTGQSKFFHYLLHSFTMPDEILGVVDIDRFFSEKLLVRSRRGSLTDPQVRAAFLDEVFNANSTILNALLSILNEREFYEGGIAYKSNLRIIAGASNRVPEEEELRAFFDRFPVRLRISAEVGERQAEGGQAFVKILEAGMKSQRRALLLAREVAAPLEPDLAHPLPTIDEFAAVHDYITMNYAFAGDAGLERLMDEEARKAFYELINTLPLNRTCTMNGRLVVKLFCLAAASALFRRSGAAEGDMPPRITRDDLHVFDNIWNSADEDVVETHRHAVERIIGKRGAP